MTTASITISSKKGDPGSPPAHQWSGTKLRFQNPDSTWGAWMDTSASTPPAMTTVAGRTVVIPAGTVYPSNKALAPINYSSTSFTIAEPASTSVTDSLTIQYGWFAYLSYRFYNTSGITLHRTSNGALLVENTDYSFDGVTTGFLQGLVNTANYAATATYTGYKTRYDLVVINRTTKVVSVVQGTERAWDPEEYMPAVPAGCEPLYRLFVYPGNVDVIPIFGWRNFVGMGQEGIYANWLSSNREALEPFLKKLRAGTAVKVMGYGDSITNMANDTSSLFFERMPSDTRTKYGATILDKAGWNWRLIDKIQKSYSSAVTYLNSGIGGSTSDNTTNNGLNSTRLNAAIALAPDLVVLAFGTNEEGSVNTYANLVSIITQFKAAGAVVIVMSPPRVQRDYALQASLDLNDTLEPITHDACVYAALDTGSAYVSLRSIDGPGNEGAIGMSPRSFAAANGFNHPGYTQLQAYGKLLATTIP